jgi:hypothetical protein
MIARNKLDKTFGPFGSSTGLFMLIGGIVATYFSFLGILFIIIGAFAAFTTSSTFIDAENKRIKYSDDLFGIIPIGKWIYIKPEMRLGLKKSHRGYVGYIRGNQPVDIHYNDIRIFLYDSNNKQIMPIKKFDSYESSKNEINILRSSLGLEIISR